MNLDAPPPEPRGAREEANFVANMRRLREEHGWSQGEMAKRMQDAGWTEFHQTTISRMEKGSRPVRLGEARGIAGVLGAVVDQMTLDEAVAQKLRDLELDLMGLRDRGVAVGASVVEYLNHRSVVEYSLSQQPEVPESATEGIKARQQAMIAHAKELLSRSYADYIDAAMESNFAGSVVLDGEDISELGHEAMLKRFSEAARDPEA